MSTSGSLTVDVQVWTHLNCLEEGGFPALLWDTLKDWVRRVSRVLGT
jgi:hypothetical protein